MTPDSPKPHPLGLTAEAFAAAFLRAIPGGHGNARAAYARLFREGVAPPGLADALPLAPIVRTHVSDSHEGAVVKFTQRVAGRHDAETLETESVLIPMIGKRRVRAYTLCVSSQVGCAMGCRFCQTAQMGLVRSLGPHEIVGQWFAARHGLLAASRGEAPRVPVEADLSAAAAAVDPAAEIRNIVFMGMGEPMDNLDAVLAAIAVLRDHRGPAIATCRITVSTVGRIDGITRLAEQVAQPGWHRLGMAISLNAPNDEVRSSIMPVNRAMPLAKLRAALELWPTYGSSHLCLEYVLIPGVNDEQLHADQLAAYVKGESFGQWPGSPMCGDEVVRYPGPALTGMVNLIPYNPRENSPWPAPSEERIDAFMARLTAHGVYVKRRRTKGRDQMAACGQLGNLAYRRKPVQLTVDR